MDVILIILLFFETSRNSLYASVNLKLQPTWTFLLSTRGRYFSIFSSMPFEIALKLMKKFNEEAVDHVQEYSSEESELELTSGSDEETDYEEWEETDDEPVNIAEGIMVDEEDEEDTSDEDYEPSISTIDENHDEDYYDEDYDEYEAYDEMRQDLNGSWYTRRQFYDWYGSDEAWDNLDPEIYHRKRYDENCDQWLTKEEMFQWYGTNIVWKKMNPKKQFKRRRICDAYSWASYLPQNLQYSFIRLKQHMEIWD